MLLAAASVSNDDYYSCDSSAQPGFSLGGGFTFLDQKSDDLFLVVTRSYVTYYHKLPLSVVFGVHLTKFSPIFALFQQKSSLQNFFPSPWGWWVHLHPLATPMLKLSCYLLPGEPASSNFSFERDILYATDSDTDGDFLTVAHQRVNLKQEHWKSADLRQAESSPIRSPDPDLDDFISEM